MCLSIINRTGPVVIEPKPVKAWKAFVSFPRSELQFQCFLWRGRATCPRGRWIESSKPRGALLRYASARLAPMVLSLLRFAFLKSSVFRSATARFAFRVLEVPPYCNDYPPGFHAYTSAADAISKRCTFETIMPVYLHSVHTQGEECGSTVLVARWMYVPVADEEPPPLGEES